MNSSSQDMPETDIWMFFQSRAVTQLSVQAERGRKRDYLLAERSLRSFWSNLSPCQLGTGGRRLVSCISGFLLICPSHPHSAPVLFTMKGPKSSLPTTTAGKKRQTVR